MNTQKRQVFIVGKKYFDFRLNMEVVFVKTLYKGIFNDTVLVVDSEGKEYAEESKNLDEMGLSIQELLGCIARAEAMMFAMTDKDLPEELLKEIFAAARSEHDYERMVSIEIQNLFELDGEGDNK